MNQLLIDAIRVSSRLVRLGLLASTSAGLTGVVAAFPQITPNNNTGTILIAVSEVKENNLSSGFNNYGRIENLGVLHNFENLKTLQIGTGDGILVNNGTLNNSGALQAEGSSVGQGEINNKATIVNTGVLFIAYDGMIVNGITGTIDNQAGSALNFWGTVSNFGAITNANANTTIAGISCLNSGQLTNHPGATLTNHSASLVEIDGIINNGGTIDNSGAFALANGGSINNSSSIHNKPAGTFSTSGALNQLAGTFTNEGSIIQSGTLTNSSSFNNSGKLTNHGTLTNHASFSNSGIITTENGTFDVTATGSVTGIGSYQQSEFSGGTLRVNGTMTQGTIDLQGGTLRGTGTVTATAGPIIIGSNARVAPGNSAGTLNLTDDLSLQGTYLAELVAQGSYDVLNVTDDVTLGSESTLSMTFSYRPLLNEVFDLLTADSITGNFGFASLAIPGDEEGSGAAGGVILSEPLDPMAPSVSVAGYTITITVVTNPFGRAVLRAEVTAVPPVPPSDPYEAWALLISELTDPDPFLDFDHGGLPTLVEWITGGDPTNSSDDAGFAPTFDNTTDPNNFIFTFLRRDVAAADPATIIVVEYGGLAVWRNTADHGAADGVTIDDSTDLENGFHSVKVSIPRSLAVNGSLFARLAVHRP